jgi:2-iminoacetate synthase ThiH
MKITKRQLRRIIKEGIESFRVMDGKLIPELVAELKRSGEYASHGGGEDYGEEGTARVIKVHGRANELDDWVKDVVDAHGGQFNVFTGGNLIIIEPYEV